MKYTLPPLPPTLAHLPHPHKYFDVANISFRRPVYWLGLQPISLTESIINLFSVPITRSHYSI